MPVPLQVLLVEDNPMDAELAIHHLEKAGFKVSSQRIETAEAMRNALSKIDWDIIISDYSLPSFDAPSALRILIESGKDIPFIVVSGTITEETAIDLMRAGAADYLMKDRLARLGPLVKRELNIAQVRKERNESQAELKISRDWSNLIYNATSDAMFLVEIEPNEVYRYVSVNAAYMRGTELTEDQVIGKRVDEIFSPQNAAFVLGKYREAIQAGHPIQYEETLAFPKGALVVDTILTPIFDQAGVCKHLLGSSHEITDRKQIEADLKNRLSALTRPPNQPGGINFKDLFDVSAIQRLQDEFSTATGVASIITYPDGTPITQPSNFCRLCKDIIRKTELGQINCFKSDAALGRYNSGGPIVQPCMSGGLWDAGAGISVGGQHVANWLIGQVRDETINEEQIRAYAHEIGADEAMVVEAFSEVPSMSQTQFKHVAQALFTMANQLSTIAYQNTQQARFITEQQRVEEELQRWVQAFQNAGWGMAIGSADGKVIELMNSAFAKMHGYTVEEMQGSSIADLFAPECRGDVPRNVQLAHQKGHHVWESRHIHKDGHTFPVLLDVTAVKDEKGQPKYRVINMQDITERKRIEENLRASQEKFSNAFRVSPDSININRLEDGLYIEVNEGFTTLSGYTEEDVLGKTSRDINIWVNPQDRLRMLQGLSEKGIVNNLEAPFRCKDGTIKICLMSAQVMEINGEKCVLSITRDITERKLKDEEYTTFIQTSIDGFSSVDSEGHYLDVNEAFCRMMGYSREELLNMHVADLEASENAKEMAEHLQKIFEAGSDHFQTLHQRKDGSLIFLEISSQYIPLEKRLYSFVHDISERKQAEAEIMKSKEALDRQNSLLNTLLETLPVGIFMVEAPTGKPLVANQAACRLLGRGVLPEASKENIGEVYEAYNVETGLRYSPDEMPILLGMKGISAHIDNMLVVRPDKTTTLLEVIGSPIADAEGKIWASLVSFQDITERKQAEKKLNDQLQELRRWHAVTLGREKRILELKNEVNKLLQNAGLPARYASALESSDE